ncbi:MAG: class I SAM-dependent methyltransferase [Zhongshania sp.]|uniref:class I SAM-dependent methyltransferase n=1 Tax=Zhongshania sp. TaxID=1971902 RepID=UPI002613ADCD|nr:class I SAM-dependent methyltransferase [Zhongshania sp.]MDF1693726.1 class I SAM-dependent methyltransferase [Zhongshania sp.]
MGFYENKILPMVIDKACSMQPIMALREQVVPLATGVVLEVGMGSGINLALYNAENIDFIWGLEPSAGMRKKARANVDKAAVKVKWLDLTGEEISLEDNSVDTVLLTYTLCTIPDWRQALQQMRRVLKPGGRLLFCEHGAAPDHKVNNWQNRVTPVWKRLAGGCHLNRPIDKLIVSCGFKIEQLAQCYVADMPRIAGYMYYGSAVKA